MEGVYFRRRSVEAGRVAGSQSPTLDVMHMRKNPVIPAGMPESNVQGWQTGRGPSFGRDAGIQRPGMAKNCI